MELCFETNIGFLRITADQNGITAVEFTKNLCNNKTTSPLLDNAKQQILEYFEKKRKNFNLKLNLKGTFFQLSVWKELQNIPYGQTVTYIEIAKRINKPKAVRAVANAIGKNPVAIIVPCHRVIGSNGKLRGYRYGTDIKSFLLNLENNQK